MKGSLWSIFALFLCAQPKKSVVSALLWRPLTLSLRHFRAFPLQSSPSSSSQGQGASSNPFDFDNNGKEISTIEASLRLDAVASAGLGISRTRMTKEINSGLVLVDGEKEKVLSTSVKENQIIQVNGIGAVKIISIATTSKGKFKIVCRRIKQSAPS